MKDYKHQGLVLNTHTHTQVITPEKLYDDYICSFTTFLGERSIKAILVYDNEWMYK